MGCSKLFSALLATFCIVTCPTQLMLAADGEPWRWSDIERVVVVPDIHGAYPAFVRLLQASDLVDEALHWIGGDTHLVSLGDLLDRGPESRKVMDLLMRLQQEAMLTAGRVHVVAGNHELMNLIGDLRYVSTEEFRAFADDETAATRDARYESFLRAINKPIESETAARQAFDDQYPRGFFAHRKAFMADGTYGKWLLSLPAFVVINDTAFVHGGLPAMVAETDPDEFNSMFRETTSQYLKLWRELVDSGVLPDDGSEDAGALARSILQNADPSNCLEERAMSCEKLQTEDESLLKVPDAEIVRQLDDFIALSEAPVFGTNGPLWYRGAIYCRDIFERPILEASLANLGVSNVVAGHTTTPDGRVHALHDNRMTMLDAGMLTKYYLGRPAALIIENDQRIVQYLDPEIRQSPVLDGLPEAYGLSRSELVEAMQFGTVTKADEADKDEPRPVQVIHNGNEIHAVYYPHDRKGLDKLELAAYTLDQLLGLELVPLTIERTLDDKQGALQLSYPDTISESQRLEKGTRFGGWCSMNRQIQLMYAWDTLTANSGRTADNLQYRQQLWRLQLTEHAQAFSTAKRLPKSISASAITLAPEVRSALSSLNEMTLAAALGDFLDEKRIRALLSRRDAMLDLFKG